MSRARPALRRWRPLVATGVAAMLAAPAVAAGVGISLDRTPAPPQAVKRGGGTEQLNYQVTFNTTAKTLTETITDPAGGVRQASTHDVSGQASPISRGFTYAPSAASPLGRYRAAVEFFNVGGFESSGAVIFDVAADLGTLRLEKYEDLNGNGQRDAGEPGVPGWVFNLTNPQGNPSTGTTGADGSTSLAGVPAGTWQVQEVIDSGWQPIAPPGGAGSVTVPANGTGTFQAGNARPAPLTGTVYMDANRNGRLDPGEVGRAGVKLTLSGGSSSTTTSAADGTYAFDCLLPGTFSVKMAVPGGLDATSPNPLDGIQVISGRSADNNNFGLATDGVAPQAVATRRPNIRIAKAGPRTSRRGGVFKYTIVVRNRSSFTAKNVVVTDLLPRQLSLVRQPSGFTLRNGSITWRIGNMRAGSRRALSFPVRVIAGTPSTKIRNTATVTATGLPPKRASVVTTLQGPPPVARSGGVTG